MAGKAVTAGKAGRLAIQTVLPAGSRIFPTGNAASPLGKTALLPGAVNRMPRSKDKPAGGDPWKAVVAVRKTVEREGLAGKGCLLPGNALPTPIRATGPPVAVAPANSVNASLVSNGHALPVGLEPIFADN